MSLSRNTVPNSHTLIGKYKHTSAIPGYQVELTSNCTMVLAIIRDKVHEDDINEDHKDNDSEAAMRSFQI